MILFPFHREIDDLFQKGSRAWLKVLVGALVGGYFGWMATLEAHAGNGPGPSLFVVVVCIISVAFVSATTVLAFCLKDIVRQRLHDGKPVNIFLRAYWATGLRSLLLRFITLYLIVALFAVALIFST